MIDAFWSRRFFAGFWSYLFWPLAAQPFLSSRRAEIAIKEIWDGITISDSDTTLNIRTIKKAEE